MNEPDALATTMPPSELSPVSVEEARLFHSVMGRLFERDQPLRIAGYRVLRRLAAGGMGEVFLAHDDELDRPVALKLLHTRLSHDEHFAARMRREARALAKLTHPNVVHVYEVGEHQGRVFIAMEYVRGESLAGWLRSRSPPWREALDAYLAAGEGLAAAHSVGLVHRDFKPDNVLRGEDGRVCVADFGLARVEASPSVPTTPPAGAREPGEASATVDAGLSAAGAVMGTLPYMPLEQLRGGLVDARSDQFAFCVALYEALWGQSPFRATSPRARDAVLAEDRPAIPQRGAVPGWVWPLVYRGLARDPQRRWPDMPTLLAQLRRGPSRVRVLPRAAAAALGLSLSLGLWLGLHAAPCAPDEAALADVWDESRRQQLRAAFRASGLGVAGEMADRVEHALDRWTASWQAEHAESCAATKIRGVQPEPMFERRSACLARARGELAALVDVFAAADADVVPRAGQALLELPSLEACSSAALDAAGPKLGPPIDSAALAGSYKLLASARVALNVGRTDRAEELAADAQRAGESLPDLALALAARTLRAQRWVEGGERERGLGELRDVVLAAERAERLDLVADARVALARAAAGNTTEAKHEAWLVEEAQLALDRAARPLDPRAVRLLSARALIAEQRGDFPTALAAHRAAYTLSEGRMEEGERALVRVGIGTTLHRSGELEPARAELEASLGAAQEAWGAHAPEVGRIAFNLAMLAADLGDDEAAERHLDAAISIDTAAWGDDSTEVARDRFAAAYLAFARGELGPCCALIDQVRPVFEARLGLAHDETAAAITAAATCRYYQNDPMAALAGFQRALTIQTELLPEGHRELALLHANLGDTYLALGRRDESLAAHERALEVLAALREDHPELASPLRGQALVWLEQDRAPEALASLERALTLADASRPLERAETLFGLARALVAVYGPSAQTRALELAREALKIFERAGVEHLAIRVREWLASG